MKTTEMIDELAGELTPDKGLDSLSRFLLKCVLACMLILGLSLFILPIRDNLEVKLSEARFAFESLLWVVIAFLSGIVAYKSSIPGMPVKVPVTAAKIVFSVLLLVILSGGLEVSLWADFQKEMDMSRSWCGPIILIIGTLGTVGLFQWAKKLAPTNYNRTGFWMATSASCLGSVAMQFVCAHDTATHLYLLHVLPTLLLGIIGSLAANKLLRW
ncbi:MAG TPA: NrsF family protein [Bacteriovoracaceae bacterium]|nr:NrsF family protein [Bacteriovoracaceae bacterium]